MEGYGSVPAGVARLCTGCVVDANNSFLIGDCCTYGSISKVVAGLQEQKRTLEEDTVRLRMAATSLESAKQVGQKKPRGLKTSRKNSRR